MQPGGDHAQCFLHSFIPQDLPQNIIRNLKSCEASWISQQFSRMSVSFMDFEWFSCRFASCAAGVSSTFGGAVSAGWTCQQLALANTYPEKKSMERGGTMSNAFYILFTSRFAIEHHPRSEIIWSLMDIKNEPLPLALLVAHPPSAVQSLLAGPANS